MMVDNSSPNPTGTIPSSPELKVRTMRSDLASIATRSSGLAPGNAPVPQSSADFQAPFVAKEDTREQSWLKKHARLIVVLGLVALAAAAGAIFMAFILPVLRGGS